MKIHSNAATCCMGNHYGSIVRPWLCVVAYLWILELQSVYAKDFEPLVDRLADAAAILWTLNLWVAIFAAFIALIALALPQSTGRRANEFVCRIGCVLISGFYLLRWLVRWPALSEGGYLVQLGIISVTLSMYFLARAQRGRLVGAALVNLPTWRDCYRYAVAPLLLASVAVLGIRIGTAFVAWKDVPKASSVLTMPNLPQGVAQTNVIVIVADALRAQSLSLYHSSGAATPVIEHYGKASSVYLDTHANATMSTTSLTSLLTGKHLLRHGRLSREFPAYPSDQNLLRVLRSHGYASAAVTSSVEASLSFLGLDGGLSKAEKFAFNILTIGWLRDLGVYPTRLGGRIYQDLRLLFPWLGFPRRTSPYGKVDDTLDLATTTIADLHQPFFLFVHIHEPHESSILPSLSMLARRVRTQLVENNKAEPEPYRHYDSALQPEVGSLKVDYEASVRAVDAQLGKFFDSLRRQPWFDSSLIILTADHGESFERGYLYHGAELYENSTWVPLLIRFPGQKNGARVSGLTQTVDIAPTILKTLGLKIPDWMDGQALDPQSPPAPVATMALNYEHPDAKASHPLPTQLAIWWQQFKLIVGCNNGRVELYDLAKDPEEQVNLSERERETVEALKLRLRQQLGKQSGPIKLACGNL